jgi:hypothetical protein
MQLKRGLLSTAAALAVCGIFVVSNSDAGVILPGHLVVTQVGDGVAALTSNATPVTVLDVTTGGTIAQSIPLGTAGNPHTASGTQTEQMITLTGDGQYLTIAGYASAAGTASPANGTGGRVITRVDLATGTPDSTTVLTDFGTGTNNNVRSVVSPDGVVFYATTANAGTRYVGGFGSGTTTSTGLNTVNARVANIYGGQLYVSSGSGTNTTRGVNTVGTGLPTTTGQTMTRLPGLSDTNNASSWDFYFADSNTLYIVDDSTSATVGGMQKWKFDGANWNLAYRIFTDGVVNFGLRSIAGTNDGITATLWVTTNESTGTRVLSIQDTLAATTSSATFTQVLGAVTNKAYRGVEFIPIPEPTSLALLMGGSLLFVRRRRA